MKTRTFSFLSILFCVFAFLPFPVSAVTLQWDPSANTATCTVSKYKLLWGTTAGGSYTVGSLETASASVLTLTVTGLTPGQRYYFVAKTLATPAGCDSGYSNEVSYTELVPVPPPGTLKVSIPTAELTGAKWPAVALGSSETRNISVRNTSDATLRILEAQTETPYSIVRAPTEILPGTSGIFRISFTPDTKGFTSAPLALNTSVGQMLVHLTGNAR